MRGRHTQGVGLGQIAALAGALLLFAAGAIANFVLPDYIDEGAARIAQMPLAGAKTMNGAAAGSDVLFEGRINPAQRKIFRDFVAYVREEMNIARRGQQWVQIGQESPPLQIDLPDGAVRVVNSDYGVRNPGATWQESVLITRGSTRYRGFEVGQNVLVLGTAAPGGVRATFVAAGTRAEYLAGQEQSLLVARVIGAVLAVAGAVLFIGTLWAMRR